MAIRTGFSLRRWRGERTTHKNHFLVLFMRCLLIWIRKISCCKHCLGWSISDSSYIHIHTSLLLIKAKTDEDEHFLFGHQNEEKKADRSFAVCSRGGFRGRMTNETQTSNTKKKISHETHRFSAGLKPLSSKHHYKFNVMACLWCVFVDERLVDTHSKTTDRTTVSGE